MFIIFPNDCKKNAYTQDDGGGCVADQKPVQLEGDVAFFSYKTRRVAFDFLANRNNLFITVVCITVVLEPS